MPQDDEAGNMSRVDTNASGEDLEMNPKAKPSAAKSPTVKPTSAKSTGALAIKSASKQGSDTVNFPSLKTAPG